MCLIIAAALLLSNPVLADKVNRHSKKRQQADQLFDQAEYAQAAEAYQKYARKGDKFAQYRLSLIHYFGLNGERDMVSAYSWAAVAQEPEIKVLRQLATLIGSELDDDRARESKRRLTEWDGAYGAVVKYKRRKRVKCTGTRVGSNCERVQRAWDLSPNQDAVDFYSSSLAPNVVDMEYVQAFNQRYGELILQEFDRFDQAAQQR